MNLSMATNWRKNSMIGASIDTSRMALAWVVVLQILGVDGLMWSTHRWSQNDLSLVRFFQIYWEIHQFCLYRNDSDSDIRSVKLCSARSSQLRQTSSSRSCSILHLRKSRSCKKTIVNPCEAFLDESLFQIMGQTIFFLIFSFPISVAMMSSPLNHIVWNWEKVRCILDDASVGCTFFQEMSACATYDAFAPVR